MATRKTMTVGQRNLNHVLHGFCNDPDCELHHPEVIEDDEQSLTARAWFLAGAIAYRDLYGHDRLVGALTELKDQHDLHL